MKKVIYIISFISVASCTSENDFEKGKKQLENQGYSNVENTGYSFWCCGKDDNFSTGFRAMDKDSTIVEGCMCSSIGKGITIRFK